MTRERVVIQTRHFGVFRYRLSTLFVVITALAVAIGVPVTHRLRIAGAVFQLEKRGAIMCDQNGPLDGREHPWGSLKDVFFSDVCQLYFLPTTRELRFSRVRPGRNPHLADPTPEETIKLTDADIRNIATLSTLEDLDLQTTDIRDEHLHRLSSLRKLARLTLGPNVTPTGVHHLQQLLPDCFIDY
jgi:hypothetical protein